MHMSDALITPLVGAAGWLIAAGFTVASSRSLRQRLDSNQPALMGVLGAFVFAAQMVNFSIPGTGSSGHLGGGLLLSILLGPHAAFLVISSVLTVQALFFADGGLFALGCNVVNLGVFTCFVAYPLVFRPLAGMNPQRARLALATIAASVVGLQLAALSVVLETTWSGISELPFAPFLAFMLPIHLGIGVVEGVVTCGITLAVWSARPDLVPPPGSPGRRGLADLAGIAMAALVVAGVLPWFSSEKPDGLEWSVRKVAGQEEIGAAPGRIHGVLARLQEATSILPDYSLPEPPHATYVGTPGPAVDAGATASGVLGGMFTLLLAVGTGVALRLGRSWRKPRGEARVP